MADPHGSVHGLANFSKAVGWQLLFECKEQIFANPVKGRGTVEAVIELFLMRMAHARAAAVRRRSRCMYLQGLGLRVACLRKLNRTHDAEGELLTAIEREAHGCIACLADLHRRLAFVYRHMGRYDLAIDAVTEAIRLYAQVKGAGHDLDGRPREACLAARATIHMYSGRFSAGEADARAALASLTAEASRSLYMSLLVTLAWCQLRLPGRFSGVPGLPPRSCVTDAEVTLGELLSLFDEDEDDEHSAVRASAHWLSGVIDGLEGNRIAAEFKLGIALEDYLALEMPAEAVVCGADRARTVEPDPRMVQARLAALAPGLVSRSSDRHEGVPDFLEPFSVALDSLNRACRAACTRRGVPLAHMVSELRDFADDRCAPGRHSPSRAVSTVLPTGWSLG